MSSFTPLFGTDADSPHCYLLRVGAYNILLDCGWNDDYDLTTIQSITQSINQSIDCVLLSHSSMAHIGALAYLYKQCNLRCPILATLPVRRMGELTMYDSYQQWKADNSIDQVNSQIATQSINQLNNQAINHSFNLDDIDRAFAAITTVKYSEDFQLERKIDDPDQAGNPLINQSNNQSSITVTPHPSGHTIGGTVWSIMVENEPILYAVDYHHARERHVESGVIEAFQRPSLLIADCQSINQSNNQTNTQTQSRRAREQSLLSTIQSTLVEKKGIVLIPTDSASRLLELLCVVCAYFDDQSTNHSNNQLANIPVILCSHTCHTVLDYARVQLEWMSEAIQRFFDQSRSNPFEMKRLILCQSINQLNQLTNHFTRPAVIFATNESLSTGLSLSIFETICSQANNHVILTLNSPHSSLAYKLKSLARTLKQPVEQAVSRTVNYKKRVKTPLTPTELAAYEKALELSINQSKLETEHTSIKQEEHETINQSINDDDTTLITAMIDEDDEATANQSLKPLTKAADQSMFYVFPAYQSSIQSNNQTNNQPGFGLPWSPPVFQEKKEDDMVDDEKRSYNQPIAHQGNNPSRFPHKPTVRPDQSINQSNNVNTPAAPTKVPTKMVETDCSIDCLCDVSFIDMNGLSDERAWRNVIGQVKPRKLILIHGAADEKERFKSNLIERGIFTSQASTQAAEQDEKMNDDVESKEQATPQSAASDILVPANRSTVTLASEQLFRASIHPSLLTQLRFSKINQSINQSINVNDFAVAHLRAALRYEQGGAQLVPPSINQSINQSMNRPPSYFLGEYKFAEIRRLLSQHGIDSEYYVKGGVLVAANGTVRIRKSTPTQISIQGVVSEQYFTIRALLYRNHTQI